MTEDALLSAGQGDKPEGAIRPLSAFWRVIVICNGCGNAMTFDKGNLARAGPATTLRSFGARVVCTVCQSNGRSGRDHLELHPFEMTTAPSKKENWSRAPVFTEDRRDPTPSLPKRSIYGGRYEPRTQGIKRRGWHGSDRASDSS